MKKALLCALLTAVMLLSLAVGVHALGEEMTVAYGTPKIDGTIDDIWATADRQQLGYCKAGDKKVNSVTLPEDCTVYASMLYDDTSLYFLFEITDNEFAFESSVGDWKNDSIYLYIDEIGDGDPTWTDQQAQIALVPEDGFEMIPRKGAVPADYELAYTFPTANTCIMEFKYVVRVLSMKQGTEFTVDFQYNDSVPGALRDYCLGWSDETDDASNNSNCWGFATLGAKGESAAAPAAAADAAPGNWVNKDFTATYEDPAWHGDVSDIDFEDFWEEGATNARCGAYYVYLKGDGKGDYSVEFETKEDGLYEIDVCLMAWEKSVLRATNIKVDDSDWIRLAFDYENEEKELEQYITGLTINLTKGTHKFTLGLPEDFDDSTVKTLYFDYFFYHKIGEMGAAASSAPAASSSDYVTDGLVAWYDGANNQNGSQDKNATVWKDASGNGLDFEVDISEEDNYWTDKSFHINSCRNYFPDQLVDVVNGDTYTVEFAAGELEFPATDWVSLIISDNDHFSLFIRVSNDNLEYKYNDANKDRPMAEDGKELVNDSTVAVTFDINSQDCLMYVDGVLVSENVPLETNIADTLFLGHESEQRNWLGDVYAVRFYNRVLSAAEIAQNAAADNAKYRGGAALPTVTVTEKPVEESRGFKKLADAAAAVGMTPITGYEWEDGTNGFGNEGPENLWDGDLGTKFCTNEFPAESEASLDATYKVTGFTMATANDNHEYNGRSPSAWTISVSADGENWTELASGDDSFFEETNQHYYNGEGTAENVAFVRFEAEGTASGTFQVSELTLYGEKTGEKPVKAEPEQAPAPEPEPEPEPEPAEEPKSEEPAAEEPKAEEPKAETPASTETTGEKKSGCGSFIGGGVIVLISVLGSAWIAKRR